MLKRLDRVEWGRLTHAHGCADGVPADLRALTSPDAEVRKNAVGSLHATICHQGSRYRASAPAVPFVFEVLKGPETQGRESLIHLLVGLAVGYAEWHVPLGFDPVKTFAKADKLGRRVDLDKLRAAEPDEEDDWDEGRQALWMKDAYQAVLRQVGTFQRLTRDADPDVRLAAVKALAWFPEAAAKSVRLVRKVARRPGPDESANAILCLGILGRYLQDLSDVDWLRAQLPPDNPFVVRVTAAVSLGVLLGKDCPDEAVTVLLEALQGDELARAQSRGVAWHWLGLTAHVGEVIRLIRPKATEPVLAALCRAAEKVDEAMAGADVFWALLSVAFRKDRARVDPTRLTAKQLRALRAIGRSPVWRKEPFFYGRLMDVGLEYQLPWAPEQYREFLAEAERRAGA